MSSIRPVPSPRRRPPRPPLSTLHPSERVRGSAILEENPASELGVVLWESYRNVGDWAATPRGRRAQGMFGAGAAERRAEQLRRLEVGPALREALETIRELLAEPRGTGARRVALACGAVAAWAAGKGKRATQFHFAAVAGLCLPEDAAQAYQAGCIARDLARWDAAEAWLEHAVAAAKRGRDRDTQARAVVGIGNLYYRQGFYGRAKEAQAAGLLVARKYGVTEVQAQALHDLFITSAETSDAARAEENASLALRAYGPSHPNVPALAHDVALFWLNSGQPARAVPVLLALLPRMRAPTHRLHVLASLAWAAGGSGRRDVFARAWGDAWTAAGTPEAAAAAAPSLLQLAYGAACLDEPDLAERAAREALRVADERGEVDVIARATSFLDSLRVGSPAAGVPGSGAAPAAAGADDGLARELAEELVLTLAGG